MGVMVEPAKVNDVFGLGPSSEAIYKYELHLFTESLFSKWGFGDGDEPDHLLDCLDAAHLKLSSDWHAVLRLLVRRHLVPALNRTVAVYDIETIHNPVRAESVDGVEVPWAAVVGQEPLPEYGLTPDHVVLTWEQIRQADEDCRR